MIFVAGIHGAGKTTFCLELSSILKVPNFSASDLIKSWRNKNSWDSEKLVSQIDENQQALICSAKELKKSNSLIILDGHFVLLGNSREIIYVEQKIFECLDVKGIILIESQADVVATRLRIRDNANWDVDLIERIMEEERAQAFKFSLSMRIPFLMQRGDREFLNRNFLAHTIASWVDI